MRLRRIATAGVVAATLSLMSGCGSGYSIHRLDATAHQSSATVVVLFEEPLQPYRAIATFSGQERTSCPEGQRYCRLQEEAKRLGADAVWIMSVDRYHYPGEWLLINDRLTRIREFTVETTHGKFLRFEREGEPEPHRRQ